MGEPIWKKNVLGPWEVNGLDVAGYGWSGPEKSWTVPSLPLTPALTIIIMAHPVVVDDELGASAFFLRSLWLTMNNQNSERQTICCDRQQVFPMTVERCGSPPCHAWWRPYSAVWVCQFYEAHYRTRRRGHPWAGDHLPYSGRDLAGAEPDIFIGGATGGASFATRGAVNGLCRTFRKRPAPPDVTRKIFGGLWRVQAIFWGGSGPPSSAPALS